MTDIKTLNDNFRQTLSGGQVMLTSGINNKPVDDIAAILNQVRTFNNFTESNDPYEEHDFGSFVYKSDKIFWKIDYYDESMQFLSPDSAKPTETFRVLTVMLASEY